MTEHERVEQFIVAVGGCRHPEPIDIDKLFGRKDQEKK